MATRKIKKRLKRMCCVCGGDIAAVVYDNRKIRGGHYFGKIPLHRKSELVKMRKSGTHKSKVLDVSFDVYNYDPKPYTFVEYWECPGCYWHPKNKAGPIRPATIKATLKKRALSAR